MALNRSVWTCQLPASVFFLFCLYVIVCYSTFLSIQLCSLQFAGNGVALMTSLYQIVTIPLFFENRTPIYWCIAFISSLTTIVYSWVQSCGWDVSGTHARTRSQRGEKQPILDIASVCCLAVLAQSIYYSSILIDLCIGKKLWWIKFVVPIVAKLVIRFVREHNILSCLHHMQHLFQCDMFVWTEYY